MDAAVTETEVPTVNPVMDTEEQALADRFYAAIQDASHGSVRSQQAMQFKVGVSDLGFCPERTRRMLDGQVPERVDVWLAFLGSAIGDHVEQAFVAAEDTDGQVLRQFEVTLNLTILIKGRPVKIAIPGHPDLILYDEGILIDVKTDYLLADAERLGPSEPQQFQRHGYAKAAWEAGYFAPKFKLSDIKVANVWVDRSGQDKRPHVDLEPFDQKHVDAAAAWLEDVVYHQVEGIEAHKAPPRDMCAVVCGFYETCRALDTDVEGRIEDPETVERVRMYREGLEMEKQGARLKKSAAVHLEGMRGVVDGLMLRWIDVDPTLVPEYTRRGYSRIDLRPLPKPKATKRKRT